MSVASHEFKECLLNVEGVGLTLSEKLILKDVNLKVLNVVRPGMQQGQVASLLGPSGMGKTRLFRIMAGLDKPDVGKVLVGENQEPVTRGRVGVVFQHYPLFDNRSVLSNLVVAGRQVGMSKAEAIDQGRVFLSRFNLEGCEGKYPAQLSGGMRQRVAIAQQFMCSDDLLLMDEPFSGLDPLAVAKMIEFIQEVAAQDELKTIIIVTHDITAAIEVSDTIWMLGRDRDEKGEAIPGAKIQHEYNLIDRELAWQKGITSSKAFMALLAEIREAFPRL
jgi:NitT/TauT family transport system ATP-binding protein